MYAHCLVVLRACASICRLWYFVAQLCFETALPLSLGSWPTSKWVWIKPVDPWVAGHTLLSALQEDTSLRAKCILHHLLFYCLDLWPIQVRVHISKLLSPVLDIVHYCIIVIYLVANVRTCVFWGFHPGIHASGFVLLCQCASPFSGCAED